MLRVWQLQDANGDQWPAEREHVFDIIESLMDRIDELESRASGLP